MRLAIGIMALKSKKKSLINELTQCTQSSRNLNLVSCPFDPRFLILCNYCFNYVKAHFIFVLLFGSHCLGDPNMALPTNTVQTPWIVDCAAWLTPDNAWIHSLCSDYLLE